MVRTITDIPQPNLLFSIQELNQVYSLLSSFTTETVSFLLTTLKGFLLSIGPTDVHGRNRTPKSMINLSPLEGVLKETERFVRLRGLGNLPTYVSSMILSETVVYTIKSPQWRHKSRWDSGDGTFERLPCLKIDRTKDGNRIFDLITDLVVPISYL